MADQSKWEILRERATKEPIGVDISDYSDEWCEGFLAGQVSVLEEAERDGLLEDGSDALPERHEQVKTPNWDTKQRCSCGVEYASRAELYHHQAPALRELLTAAESDRDRWRMEARNLRRLVSWLCDSDEINIVIGSERVWVTINGEERVVPAKLEKALVVALDAAEGEDGP